MKYLLSLTFVALFSIHSFGHNKRIGLEFIENKGQWNQNVQFRAGLGNGSVYLENDGFTFSMLDAEEFAKLHDLQFASREEQLAFSVPGHAWKLNFLNTNESSNSGEKKKSYYHNYFLGQDQSRWQSNVGIYEMVNYESIYDNINLKVYSKNQNFKYDFIVKPGGNPEDIRFSYEGLDNFKLKNGKLILETSVGEFIESEPYAYQLIDGKLTKVECYYELTDKGIGYALPNGYNPEYQLVIDPELIASTLSGTTGSASNYGHSATYDNQGNVYTGCVASSDGYPTTTGAFDQTYGGGTWDIGISKLNPTGSELYWATFLGGSSSDYPHSIIVNGAEELYVYGTSDSDNYPTTENAYQTASGGGTDIVISHLTTNGSELIGSTFLGGANTDGRNSNSSNYGDTYRGEIIIDYDFNPVIATGSASTDFPILSNAYQNALAGEQDAVLIKLNEDLSELLVSTFYGTSGNDMGYAVKAATDGTYIVGGSASEGLTITENAYQSEHLGDEDVFFGSELDGFICRFNSEGSDLIASTYHGTEKQDQVFFLDLDIDENIYVYGQGGGTMPVTDGAYSNPDSRQFITKFNPELTEVMAGTVVGTGNPDFTDFVPDAFLVDNCNFIYISAYSAGTGLALTDDALFTTGGFYVAVFEEDFEDIEFGTLYTGNHVDGGTSRFDKNGIVYQGVCSGGGFNTTDDAWATDQSNGWDIGVFKIDFNSLGVNAAVSNNDPIGCADFEIQFDNLSVGDEFEWDFGNGETSTEFEPSVTYETTGTYEITLIAKDSLSCNLADTITFEIAINSAQEIEPLFELAQIDCDEFTVQSDNQSVGENLQYSWDMGDGTLLNGTDVIYNYSSTGTYDVMLTIYDEACDIEDSALQSIDIYQDVIAQILNGDLDGCAPLAIDFDNNDFNGSTVTWNFGDGTVSNGDDLSYTYLEPGTYDVTLTMSVDDAGTCEDTAEASTTVEVFAQPVVDLGVTGEVCGSFATLDAGNPGANYTWQDGSSDQNLVIYESGTYSVTVSNGICSAEDEIEVELIPNVNEVGELIPNVFSPNGDDYNELFRIMQKDTYNGTMQIYNRWGTKVHESKGISMSWDGKINGKLADDGVYFYVINVTSNCSNVPDREYTGSVTVLR